MAVLGEEDLLLLAELPQRLRHVHHVDACCGELCQFFGLRFGSHRPGVAAAAHLFRVKSHASWNGDHDQRLLLGFQSHGQILQTAVPSIVRVAGLGQSVDLPLFEQPACAARIHGVIAFVQSPRQKPLRAAACHCRDEVGARRRENTRDFRQQDDPEHDHEDAHDALRLLSGQLRFRRHVGLLGQGYGWWFVLHGCGIPRVQSMTTDSANRERHTTPFHRRGWRRKSSVRGRPKAQNSAATTMMRLKFDQARAC